jgi:hypothetical protein
MFANFFVQLRCVGELVYLSVLRSIGQFTVHQMDPSLTLAHQMHPQPLAWSLTLYTQTSQGMGKSQSGEEKRAPSE